MYHGQNLQPLTGNVEVSIKWKILERDEKNPNIRKVYALWYQGVSNKCNIDIFTQSSVREYEIIPTGSVKKINVHPLESFLKEKFIASNACSLWILDTV